MADAPRFSVIGAGLAGTLMAVYLARQGFHVDVYERRKDMRTEEVERGRSINLALSTRGLHALQEVGLLDRVMRDAIPMRGRMIHNPDGSLELQRYSIHESEVIYSVSRRDLNILLLNAAEQHSNVSLHFEMKCTGLDFARKTAVFDNKKTANGIVIAADGAFSAVRNQLQKRDRFDYSQTYLSWGYKELTMPPAAAGQHAMDKNALHIWPRRNFMLIALPNADGSFTCTLFLPHDAAEGWDASFQRLQTDADVEAFFKEEFPDALPLMPTLLDDFQHNPTSSLVYLRCSPWHVDDWVVLLGDACHAVVPFYGQGMNAAFEDCTVLNAALSEHAPDWPGVFRVYQASRKVNTDALGDLSLRNFIEMRDRVATPWYHFKKAADDTLQRLLGDAWLPLYSMVTFSRIPYAEAVRRAESQDRLLRGGMAAAVGLALLALLR